MLGIRWGFCVVAVAVLLVESKPTPKNSTQTDRIARLRIISLKSNLNKEARNHTDHEVIFPEDYDVIFDAFPRINGIPKCSKGDTFCENYEGYPKHHLRQVLAKKESISEFFGEDEEAPFIVNRHGGLEETVNYFCPSREGTYFPRVGKNKNNKWKFIINQGEDGYIQGVRLETCRRINAPCDIISDLPLGYITSCKQKYIYRRLMSVSDRGELAPDSFKLPSACCCSYKVDMEFLSRHGSQKLKAVTPIKTFKLS